MAQGPLNGLRIIEFAGIGPAPFCGMLLSDLGADVVRIDRAGRERPGMAADVLSRGRRSIALDLKSEKDIALVMQLLKKADGLIEGFRPGVMERIGLGPDAVLSQNPALVYGRMTGWGQDGPLAHAAGHDLNYIALTGALHAMGDPEGRPRPPLNLVGDFGGGALYLAFGMMAALWHVQAGGKGQVVDCAMTDGAASLSAMFYGLRAMGIWSDTRGANLLDGGAPFYDTYACSDGKWVSVAAIEPQFYAELRDKAGLTDAVFDAQMDRDAWPAQKAAMIAKFKTRTRVEWCEIMEGSDVCFAPVLSWEEAPEHPQNTERRTLVESGGVVQPAPAPRFSATPGAIQRQPAGIGGDREEILSDWGVNA